MLQVLEETGFDVGSRLKINDYIEIHMQEKRCRLYIIQGVSSLSRRVWQVSTWQQCTTSVPCCFVVPEQLRLPSSRAVLKLTKSASWACSNVAAVMHSYRMACSVDFFILAGC